ncbi:hypothetical protein TWF281_002205 [Arthrobotrys megalospora]
MSTTSRAHTDYTVGWVCALKEELVAAKLMLDETHPRLPPLPNDGNTYTLGSIGEHNVVIACLPEAGTNTAATVATWMASSFTNVKIGLLVGIGGGIPPKVKLGDIVVSKPTDGYTGVVQHDFGKVESGCPPAFRRTKVLRKSPTLLLTALAEQRADHDINGFDIHQSLNDLRNKHPRLKPEYTRRPNFPQSPHNPQIEDSGVQPQKEDDLQIHYGLIVSGNQVIKNATIRDSLDKNLDGRVLCVEMEAAGLMDDFPCIVIRGISDYADENKNDDWHQYAAAVAAVYARDFLKHIRPADIREETPINDVIQHQG